MATRASIKKWLPVETIPIFGIVGLAVGGATYYLYRLSQGPEVVWDRSGDWKPWDKIKHDQNQKLITVNHDFWAKRKEEAAERASFGNKRPVDQI